MATRAEEVEQVIEALRREIALYGITAAELGFQSPPAPRRLSPGERPQAWADRRGSAAPARSSRSTAGRARPPRATTRAGKLA